MRIKIPHQRRGYIFNYLRFFYHFFKTVPNLFGSEKKMCPCCGAEAKFLAFGRPIRLDVICPSCGSFERHRFVNIWLKENSEKIRGKRVLHFAPEELIAELLSRQASEYIGADYAVGKADRQLNIENLDLADASIDLVVCLHVLEHVNDTAALSELYRVLAPGGEALLMFPIIEAWADTLEESDLPHPIRNVKDRIKYFGQYDHVRYYGRDVRNRIRNAGFQLKEAVARQPDVARYGLMPGETIFIASRPTTFLERSHHQGVEELQPDA